jgi:soluble lytic murein transglycosylase-like protein
VKYAPILAVVALAACSPRPPSSPPETPTDAHSTRREIWAEIQPMAREEGIDPGFVFAIVKLESDFNPRARNGEAHGLMQIKPRTWKLATDVPFDPGAWDPRENLRVGIAGLASIKRRLEARGVFSYRLMWAAFHYGFDYVEERGFDMSRIPRPSDPISRSLWAGEVHPVETPR